MRIKSVQAWWVQIPIEESRQHVSDLGRLQTFDAAILRIETESGIVGWGEGKNAAGSAGNYSALVHLLNHEFGPRLIGRDASEITPIWEDLYNGPRAAAAAARGHALPELARRGLTLAAISAVDIALWDIRGKALDQPIWALLGGRSAARLPAYASGGRVKAARKALGPDVELMVDAHGTYTVAEARRFAHMVADCDLAWFEEPVNGDDRAGLAEFRAATSIPVALGEAECTRFDFAALIAARAVDILQPDPAFCGGITEAMRIAALAASFNLRLAPHLWAGAPCFFAGLQVLAAAPAGFMVEFSLGANPMIHTLSRAPVRVVDGLIDVPDGPGLGLDMDTDMIARYAIT